MSKFCSECGKPCVQGDTFCTQCGAALHGHSPASHLSRKRERVLQSSKRTSSRTIRYSAITALFGLAFLWVYSNAPEGGNPIITSQPVVVEPARYSTAGQQMFDVPVSVENGSIVFPLDLLQEKKFLAFNYSIAKARVPLLAYISDEGKIVTAVSMCEPCNSTRFHIRGDELVCNACGSTWTVKTLEATGGSCGKYPPDVIPNTITGGKVYINEQVVAQWQRRA